MPKPKKIVTQLRDTANVRVGDLIEYQPDHGKAYVARVKRIESLPNNGRKIVFADGQSVSSHIYPKLSVVVR